MSDQAPCALCQHDGGRLVWRGADWRLVHADDAASAPFPAFYRLVCNHHVAEWSDWPPAQRAQAMEAVTLVEQALRQHVQPLKINLATLGNVVPHLHWHIIARFSWDSHFPGPVWAQALRPDDAGKLDALRQRLPTLEQELAAQLQQHFSPA